jgi:hypothetical protein
VKVSYCVGNYPDLPIVLINSERRTITSPNRGAISFRLPSVCPHVTARNPLRRFPFRRTRTNLLAVLDTFLCFQIKIEITDTFKIFCMRLYCCLEYYLPDIWRKEKSLGQKLQIYKTSIFAPIHLKISYRFKYDQIKEFLYCYQSIVTEFLRFVCGVVYFHYIGTLLAKRFCSSNLKSIISTYIPRCCILLLSKSFFIYQLMQH